MNAISDSVLLTSTNLSVIDPDAKLIRMCDAHASKIVAVNDGDKRDDHPDWKAYEQSCDFIAGNKAITLAGVLAKARAAEAEAVLSVIADGEINWDNRAAAWSVLVTQDLLALGKQSVAIHSDAGSDLDAALLAKTDAYFDALKLRPEPIGLENVAGSPECDSYEAGLEAFFSVESDLFREALVIRARTFAGLRAKAELIRAWECHEWHVNALLKDLLAGSAVA